MRFSAFSKRFRRLPALCLAALLLSGGVRAAAPVAGDLNGDGKVNGKDTVLLQRTVAGGYGLALPETTCDVNGDEALNGKDVTHLLRYAAGGYHVQLAERPDFRQMAVDYMRQEATIQWTPDRDIESDAAGTYEAGVIYTGLPYGNDVDASMMEFTRFLDGDNVYSGPEGSGIKGVDCSSSVLAAWCRFAASVDYSWTWQMLPYTHYRGSHGATPVGGYALPESAVLGLNANWETDRTHTGRVLEMNGEQTIYECYAKLLPADAVVMYKSGGHTRMVSAEPVVVRDAGGAIDPAKSYVRTIEITNPPFQAKDAQGNEIQTCWLVDHKYTFRALYINKYIPLTCPELLSGGTEFPVLTVEGGQDVAGNLGLTGTLRSNYRLFRVAAEVTDEAGGHAAGAEAFPLNMVDFSMASKSYELSGLNEDLRLAELPAGRYTLTLTAVVGTEERTVLTCDFQL